MGTELFCDNCGAGLLPNAKFCGKCGSTIQEQPSSEIGQAEVHKPPSCPELKKWVRNPIVCFALGVILTFCFTSPYMMSSSHKDLYRLKYAANVESIDVNGHAKENISLQAGTVIAFVSNDERSISNARLKPSGMSCIEFKNTRPKNGAVFEAMIKLSDDYYGKVRNYKDHYWSVKISLTGEDERLQGYVYKDSDSGKEIFEATKSGCCVKCLVLVESLNDYMPDLVFIKDFCPLN